MKKIRRKLKQEHPFQAWLMSLIAAMIFAIPTAILLWFLGNKELALWGATDAYIGSNGFWIIIGIFLLLALIFPKAFPNILGKIWHAIINFERFW